jgi:hypothetical protein
VHSFVFRENRVPHYQRLFQRKDGVADRWRVCLPLLLPSLAVRYCGNECMVTKKRTRTVIADWIRMEQTPRSPIILYPFYAATAVCLTSSMYMMGRLVLVRTPAIFTL